MSRTNCKGRWEKVESGDQYLVSSTFYCSQKVRRSDCLLPPSISTSQLDTGVKLYQSLPGSWLILSALSNYYSWLLNTGFSCYQSWPGILTLVSAVTNHYTWQLKLVSPLTNNYLAGGHLRQLLTIIIHDSWNWYQLLLINNWQVATCVSC